MKTILTFMTMSLAFVLPSSILAQITTDYEFDTINWVLPENYQIVEYEGENALLIEQSANVFKTGAMAYLKDYEFSDGIIEFDMFTETRTLIFIGFPFRLTTHNEENRYELFFFLPFVINTIGTVQYMPVNNGTIYLQHYSDDIYKEAGDVPANQWNHVRAEIEGPRAVVYVNDEEIMRVNNLGRGLSKGSIGVWAGDTSPKCYFANFSVTQ